MQIKQEIIAFDYQHPFNGLLSRTTWVSWHRKLNHSGF